MLRIPGVEISVTWGRLGLEHRPPELDLAGTMPRVEVDSGQPGVAIDLEHARVDVDMSPSWYDLGYRDVLDFGRESARRGLEAAGDEAARYAREGDLLMTTEGDVVPELAGERVKGETPRTGLVWIRGPAFNVAPHRVAVEHERGEIRIAARPGRVDMRFRRGRVDTYLLQEPGLEIEARQVDMFV